MRAPGNDRSIWVDGVRRRAGEGAVPFSDEGLLAGVGLFETLALSGGRVLDRGEHLERLVRGAEQLGVPLPPPESLERTIEQAASEETAATAWLKIVLTRGGRWAVFTGALDPAEEGRDVTAVLLPWRRSLHDPLAGTKSLNYAANVLGLELARRRGADEGLWLNARGHLAEGCASNLFVIRGRRLFTPSLRDGILGGVVRALALRSAREAGIVIHEGKLRIKRLRAADEAFLTSSLGGVRPLVRFEDRPLGAGRRGTVTEEISSRVASIRGGG